MPAPLGNLFALGNKGGKPPIFKSPAEMEKKVQEYFDSLHDEATGMNDIPSVTELALYMGFSCYQSFDDYSDRNKGHEEYAEIIKRAKDTIKTFHEKRLAGTTPTGSIFWLKNQGWRDTQQIDHTNNGTSFNHLTDEQLLAIAAKLLDSKSQE
jgi:hypothetical protein